jgi:hypothetical protein
LYWPTVYAEDIAKQILFWCFPGKRHRQIQALEQAQTLSDCHVACNQIMPAHQIPGEIQGLLAFLAQDPIKIACEIGTADGGTNLLLMRTQPNLKLMIGVDLYVRNKARLRYFARDNQETYYLDGPSNGPQTLERMRQALNGRTLDLLFIDGDHSYEAVKQDFLNYRGFVHDGGLVVFHDIVPDYKARYGRYTPVWAGEVPVFWGKIKSAYSFREFINDPDQDAFGIGVIYYDSKVQLPEGL